MGMDVQAYNNGLHYDVMCSWLRQRESFIPKESEMPRIGFVIYNDHFPVAMAFLRQVEGNFAQLDGLVTNPEATSKERHEGIWTAVEEVMRACKALNIRHVMSFSTDSSVIDRAPEHGFLQKPAMVLIKELK